MLCSHEHLVGSFCATWFGDDHALPPFAHTWLWPTSSVSLQTQVGHNLWTSKLYLLGPGGEIPVFQKCTQLQNIPPCTKRVHGLMAEKTQTQDEWNFGLLPSTFLENTKSHFTH